jgi:ApbE superfamily uncharacterized protein (UPF0280 family)
MGSSPGFGSASCNYLALFRLAFAAAIVVSHSAALADAAASTLGNLVHREEDITPALEKVFKMKGIQGAVVILGDKLGAIGDVELVSL